MPTFEDRFQWQSRFADQVVRIIAPYLIQVSRPHVDKNENGDFEISFPKNGTVGCRLRTPECAKYAGDVTFRTRSKYGGRTEINKVIEGYGDFFFYGHVNDDDVIWHWYLLDFASLRAIFIRKPRLLHKEQKANPDGTMFIPFDAENELTSSIIAKSREEPSVITTAEESQKQHANTLP